MLSDYIIFLFIFNSHLDSDSNNRENLSYILFDDVSALAKGKFTIENYKSVSFTSTINNENHVLDDRYQECGT